MKLRTYVYNSRTDWDDWDVLQVDYRRAWYHLVDWWWAHVPRVLREAHEVTVASRATVKRLRYEAHIAAMRARRDEGQASIEDSMALLMHDVMMPQLRAEILGTRGFMDIVNANKTDEAKATWKVHGETVSIAGLPVVESDLVPPGTAYVMNPNHTVFLDPNRFGWEPTAKDDDDD